ncbi:MAG: hypothetical protein CME06_06995 [Gemmatimonadetes bacterium]|nr:hypothetical protein [Gemmatimonadota bacterium]
MSIPSLTQRSRTLLALFSIAAALIAGCGSGGFFDNPYTDRLESQKRRPAHVTPASAASTAASRAPHPKGETPAPRPIGPRCSIERGPLPEAADVLEIVLIDVGQGDAILVVAPNGRTLLVDGGMAFHASSGAGKKSGGYQMPDDMGKKAVLPFLRKRGIDRLNIAVGSHPHADHIGGLVTVAGALGIDLYVDPGVPYSSDTYAALLERLAERKIAYRIAKSGDTLDLDPRVEIRILGPEPPQDENVNNSSVVLEISYGGFVALLTGDAEAEEEAELVQSGQLKSACLLKVGHHGSRSSSTAAFVETLRPSIAAISCGRRNKFGHPHRSTIDRFDAAGVEVLRTDLDGTIRFLTDGKRLEVKTLGKRR